MAFFGDLFTPRTYTCETCAARAQTISILEEEVEHLKRLLDEEREKSMPRPVEVNKYPDFEGNVRKSRVPWSRKQAELEQKSAREAALEEQERWKKRVEAVDAERPKLLDQS